MKKIISIVISFVILAVLGVVALGQYVTYVGERESLWITKDFWNGRYFNVAGGLLADFERVNLNSLRDGSSKDDVVVGYVAEKMCRERTSICYLSMLSAANTLMDGKYFDSGTGLADEAYRQKIELCPVSFESTLLRYKISQISGMGFSASRREARAVVERIKKKGGLIVDLRTDLCDKELTLKPEFFHAYVVLVSKVMDYAGGELAIAGAYIQAIDFNRVD